MGVTFTVVSSNFEERLDHNRSPAAVATELALGKARAVAAKHPDALVIGGDTIVTVAGTQLDKPATAAQARHFLRIQAGQSVLVTSVVVLICKNKGLETSAVDEATVQLKPYDEASHEAYIATEDWRDKAGGWGLQSGAGPLAEYVQGRFDTVLGLPTGLLAELLQAQGIAARPLELKAPIPTKPLPPKHK